MGPVFDVIAVLGRGIEQVRYRDGTLRWRPTTFIGKCEPGTGAHTGFRIIRPDPDDPDCLIGGANANVIAAVQLFSEMLVAGHEPKAILFAFGARAQYLRDRGWPLEGQVLKEEFLYRVGRSEYAISPAVEVCGGIDSTEPRYFPSNTNTEVRNILDFAVSRNLRRVAIITVEVHIGRAKMFAAAWMKQSPYRVIEEPVFFSAEDLLVRRSRHYRRIVRDVRASSALARNAVREANGMIAFCAGAYHPTG